MSIQTLADLTTTTADLVVAASSAATPGIPAAAGAPTNLFNGGSVSSVDTGQNTGIEILNAASLGIAPNIPAPTSTGLTSISPFPASLDTFTQHSNDTGEIAQPEHFNELIAGVRALEDYTESIARTAPGDLLDRLTAGSRTLSSNGTYQIFEGTSNLPSGSPTNPSGSQSSFTPNSTSAVKRPVLVTVGGKITISGTSLYTNFNPPPSVALNLSSAQKTALGLSSNVQSIRGLAFFGSAKLQVPNVNPLSYDSSASSARVEIRVDDAGTCTAYLCPGPYCASTDTDPIFYSASPSNVPYLLPGIWYVWVTFVSSVYQW